MFYGSHDRRFIFGVIQSPEEVLEDPQFAHRDFFVKVEHPVMGKLMMPGAPFRMESTPWKTGHAAPSVGQNNGQVFEDRLGLTREQIAQLRSEGII